MIKNNKFSYRNFRYKICFQTLSKIGIYKNSRIRYCYNIRSHHLLLQGKIAKNFIIFNNMKWRVIRRRMVPSNRKKIRFKYEYKRVFFNKQQLKNFYGKLHEYKIRNIFKKTWNIELFYRKNIFIGALEQRINVILFRMRMLPTIFSCTQLILHKGILVNNNVITLPSYRIKIGDIVSIPKEYWVIFYDFLFERVYFRLNGETVEVYRAINVVNKLQYYRLKNKSFHKKSLKIMNNYLKYKKYFLNLKNIFKSLLKLTQNFHEKRQSHLNEKWILKKRKKLENKIILNNNYFNIILKKIIYINYFLEKNFRKIFLKLRKSIKKVRRYIYFKVFYKMMRHVHFKLFFINKILLKFFKFAIDLMQYISDYFYFKDELFFKFNKFFFKINENLNEKKSKYINIFNHYYWKKSLKKKKFLKRVFDYNKYLWYKIKQMKFRKRKIKKFRKYWCVTPHWYTPSYLEIDYCTLRCVFIRYPENNEVFFGFPCSFNNIISFYKERAL